MKDDISIRLSTFLFVILILQSCQGQNEKEKNNGEPVEKNKISKDIPLAMRDSSFMKMKLDIENKIGLSSIENGYSDLQIRIWNSEKSLFKNDLLVLKKKRNNWSSEAYTITLNYDKNYDTLVSIDKKVVSKMPKSGWDTFTDSLFQLNILNLPDYKKIPNYNMDADDTGVRIEIATNDSYRIYSYPGVVYYQDKIEQTKKVYDILKLLNSQFGE